MEMLIWLDNFCNYPHKSWFYIEFSFDGIERITAFFILYLGRSEKFTFQIIILYMMFKINIIWDIMDVSKKLTSFEMYRVFCESNGCNIPGHSKRARTYLACRVEAKYRYGCLKHSWRCEISNQWELIYTYANSCEISQV